MTHPTESHATLANERELKDTSEETDNEKAFDRRAKIIFGLAAQRMSLKEIIVLEEDFGVKNPR